MYVRFPEFLTVFRSFIQFYTTGRRRYLAIIVQYNFSVITDKRN